MFIKVVYAIGSVKDDAWAVWVAGWTEFGAGKSERLTTWRGAPASAIHTVNLNQVLTKPSTVYSTVLSHLTCTLKWENLKPTKWTTKWRLPSEYVDPSHWLAIVRAVRVDVYQTPQGKQTGGAARASSFEERPKWSRGSLGSIRIQSSKVSTTEQHLEHNQRWEALQVRDDCVC